MQLELLMSSGPWAAAAIVAVIVAGRCIVAIGALRGAESKDRAAIIKAVSDLFRLWHR